MNLANAIKNPLTIYYCGDNTLNTQCSWNTSNTAPGKKTIYDPSPEGWKVPMNGVTLNGGDLLANGAGIFAKLALGGSADKDAVTLANGNSYFNYSRYYSLDRFYKNEATINYRDQNPRGGRIFFLADDISDAPGSWTIENTMWMPVSAERHRTSGTLSYPSLGHIWLADISSGKSGYFAIEPSKISLGFYYFSYGWSVRSIQDNKQ